MNNRSENTAETTPAEVVGRSGQVAVIIEMDPGDPIGEEFMIEPESPQSDLTPVNIDPDYLARPIDMTELPFDWSALPEADFKLISPGFTPLIDEAPARPVAPAVTRAGIFEKNISRRPS